MKQKIVWKKALLFLVIMGGLYYITSSFLISLGIILILFVIDALLWEWEENRKIKQRKRDHNHQTSDHQ